MQKGTQAPAVPGIAARRIAALGVLLLFPVAEAWSALVSVRFKQPADCDSVVRWELVGARISASRPSPNPWDATVAATIAKTLPSGSCGSEQRATIEADGAGGPTRLWLRAVAASGVAVSGSLDVDLPRTRPETNVPMTTVGGGGDRRSDCLLVFVAPVNHPASRPRDVRCIDGDPRCDADGVTNGQCAVPVAVCANSTFLAGTCQSPGVASVKVRGADPDDRRYGPEYALLQSQIELDIAPPSGEADLCTSPVTLLLPLSRGALGSACRPIRKRFTVVAHSSSGPAGPIRDRDRLVVSCWPSAAGC